MEVHEEGMEVDEEFVQLDLPLGFVWMVNP